MKRFVVGLLATIGALAIFAVAGFALAVWLLLPRDPPALAERIVLTLDLREALDEIPGGDPLEALGFRRQPTLTEVVLGLDRASRDPRVQGVIARLEGEGPGFAQVQELRAAIARLRASDRFALAWSDSFGEFGPGTRGYYLATSFDEIHLQPVGSLGLTGLLVEVPLLRGLFDNIGVQPSGDKRGRYKNAADIFTERTLTPAHRESLESLADSIDSQIRTDLGEARGLAPAAVGQLIDNGPYAAEEAAEAGLVDRLSYWDEVLGVAEERAGAGSERVRLMDYLLALEPPPEDAPVVALIHGVGQIRRGQSERGPARSWFLGGDTVAAALAAAVEDDEVEAILFRIDSGGGSAVASETIAREVRRAVEAGKPVIVSMGEVAASGGYWIAMDASAIVARPATLTGSIGVFAGKPVLAEFWERIGVNWGRVTRGENAAMWSPNVDFDPRERARLEAFLDRTYAAFVDNVARARGLPRPAVLEAAEGRVWTGAQARERGLVDDLGGFSRALALAREAAGVAPDQAVELRPYPAPRPAWLEALDLLRQPLVGLRSLAAWLEAAAPAPLAAPPLVLR